MLFFSRVSTSIVVTVVYEFFVGGGNPMVVRGPPDTMGGFMVSTSSTTRALVGVYDLVVLFSTIAGCVSVFSGCFCFLGCFKLLYRIAATIFGYEGILLMSFLLNFSKLDV